MRASTILVPLDGTIRSVAALPVAGRLAEIERATLQIVYVGERILPPLEQLESIGLTTEELWGSVLNQATGNPAEEIVRLADEWRSTYIVLCTHTGVEKPRGVLGHVAEAVLRSASCPVVLVQPDHGQKPWTLHRILLPHDGTQATAAAVGPAADLADQAGAELIVLHIAALTTGRLAEPGTLRAPRYLDQPQHEWAAWASEFLARVSALGDRSAAVKLRLAVATGEPGAEVVRFAREHDVDLIVLAWSGRWEPKRAATLKAVIRGSGCPVLIIRAGPERLAIGSEITESEQTAGKSG